MISKWMGVISLVLPIAAQTNDWRTVEQLKPGTPISIVEHGRQECELDSVTDSELICVMPMSRITRKLVYARSQIQEVRREMPDHNSIIVGAIAGGIAGDCWVTLPHSMQATRKLTVTPPITQFQSERSSEAFSAEISTVTEPFSTAPDHSGGTASWFVFFAFTSSHRRTRMRH